MSNASPASPRLFQPPRRGLFALLGVVALHLVLFSLLSRSPVSSLRRHATPVTVNLRLLPWLDRRPKPPEPPELRSLVPALVPAPIPIPVPAAAAAKSARAAPRNPASDEPSARMPVPATPVAEATAPRAIAEAAPLPQPPASDPPRPLDLNLPSGFSQRAGLRNPALGDALVGTARPTPEQRMARSFDQRLTEERLGDGRVRLRRGDSCLIASPARTSELFPADDSAARAPRTLSACP